MNKKKSITLVLTISLLLITMISATFAYYTSLNVDNLEKLNVTANIAYSNSVFSSIGNNIELNITAEAMQQANQNNVVATDTKNLSVSFLSGTTSEIKCTYDIYYKWDSNSDTYTITDNTKNEFTYQIPDIKSETNYVASSNTTPQKVNALSLTISNSSETVPTVVNHEITSKFYNIDADQKTNANKNWKLNFYVDNVVCGSMHQVNITDVDEDNNTLGTRSISCEYGQSVAVNPTTYANYDSPESETITCGENNNVTLTYQSQGTNLVTLLENKVASSDQVAAGSNGYIQKQAVTVTQNSNLGINSSSYENIIYTGANPNNFIEFNGEMWRIIGVYNEDSHGIANTRLVKIIRNDNLIVSSTDTSAATARWDYKINGVGSNISGEDYGSNEWSDSQLMFMLNGEDAINKGKIYNGAAYTYANTGVNGNYIQTRRNTGTYYTIWNKTNGSYLSYDGSGNAYSNKTIYTSSQATTSSYSENSAVIAKTLSEAAQNKIQEVTWHLGGYPGYTKLTNYYQFERDNYEEYHIQTSTSRGSMWIGKIGLMYLSDYGYATSGGSTSNREDYCLTQSMDNWNYVCELNDWLRFAGSTSSQGNALTQWTLTPCSNNTSHAFYVHSNGFAVASYTYGSYGVRPVLYLKADTAITDEGDGSYTNPYVLF